MCAAAIRGVRRRGAVHRVWATCVGRGRARHLERVCFSTQDGVFMALVRAAVLCGWVMVFVGVTVLLCSEMPAADVKTRLRAWEKSMCADTLRVHPGVTPPTAAAAVPSLKRKANPTQVQPRGRAKKA